MKSIKSKIQISMLSVVLIGSVLIGIITALLNATGIDAMMEKTLGPATQMAADAVLWKMDSYWTALQEAAAYEIFQESEPTASELASIHDNIAQRNGFLYTGKMDADGFSSTGYSYAEEDYFLKCKETMKPYISDIMNDGEQMIFLLEVPIIIDGRFDGVVYGGINADFLSEIVVNLAMGNDGVAYVLDSKGNVIGHREQSVVEEGSNMFETSQREFKSTLDRSILLTILVVILVVIETFPVAVKVGQSISGPIRACVIRLEKLADGDLQTPTPVVKSRHLERRIRQIRHDRFCACKAAGICQTRFISFYNYEMFS